MGCIVLSALSYFSVFFRKDRIFFVGWIVSYRLDCIAYCIILAGLDRIVSYRLDQEALAFTNWLVTTWMGRMDWMGRWWDKGWERRTLTPAGT